MLGFKSFHCTRILISGTELMHMINKGQKEKLAAAEKYPTAVLLTGA